MRRGKPAQYTIRRVPEAVDRALRKRAREQGRSLNEVALAALAQAVAPGQPKVYTDLDGLIGTWVEDPEFDRAVAEQDQIDEDAWR
ncbi:MAG: Arc family DNA-binding protein [Planctomycetes bacterium]|nr:Arc family DNA-binding protein [Planctomycetota bacterium]